MQVFGGAGGAGDAVDIGQVLFDERLVGCNPQALVGLAVGKRNLPHAAHRQGLEFLGAHQGAHAGAPGRAAVIRQDRGERHAVLSGEADAGNARLRFIDLGFDASLCFVGVRLAPQVGRVASLDLAVVNP